MELVAIDNGDSKQTINKYVADNKFTFKVAMGGPYSATGDSVFAKYGVQAFPTIYLLDSSGKIVFRSVGFDDSALMSCTDPLVTSVRQPIEAMGRGAVATLVNQIGGAPVSSEELLFEPELIVRASTGPVATARPLQTVGSAL